ncbi:MAG: AEC family transporter [Pseudomonadota bacterium]
MTLLLELTLPLFAVAGLGLLAAATRMLGNGAVRALNVFVFWFAMPALLVKAIGSAPFASVLDARFFAAYLIAGLSIFFLAALCARVLTGADLGRMAMAGQASCVANLGFLGLPLTFAAFGPVAAGPFAMAMIVDLVIIIPMTIALLEWAKLRSARRATTDEATTARLTVPAEEQHTTPAAIARNVVLNPFFLSIVAGLALSASGLSLPVPATRFLDFLSGAAGPTALFALGASLAGRRVAGDGIAITIPVVIKLVAHPVLAAILLGPVFGVRAEWLAVGIVFAALPIAGNSFVLAEQYSVAVRRTSSAILISTALGVVTVAVALGAAGR